MLQDNLFLIPPCRLKQMVFFSFPPFLPDEAPKGTVKREWREAGACLLTLSCVCFLQAEQYLQLLIPNLNWFQRSGTGMHKQWTLFHVRGTAEAVARWPFLSSLYSLHRSDATSVDQHLWQMSPLLSIRNVSMNHFLKSNITTKLTPGQLLTLSFYPNNTITHRKGALVFNYCRQLGWCLLSMLLKRWYW